MNGNGNIETVEVESPPEPVKGSFKRLYSVLNYHEKDFIRVSLRTGDYRQAAKAAGHKNPFDLLSRDPIREVLLAAAPYCASDITAALVRPYILQNLINKALGGDVPASKVLLDLDAKGPKTAKKITYGSRSPGGAAAKDHPATPQDEPQGDD